MHESLCCIMMISSAKAEWAISTCCHVVRRARGAAAAGLAEGADGDVVGGAALQSRQAAGRGRVPAEHHAAAASRPGLVQVRASHGSPGDPHRVAWHEHGPEVTWAARSCVRKGRQGNPNGRGKLVQIKKTLFHLSVCFMSSLRLTSTVQTV